MKARISTLNTMQDNDNRSHIQCCYGISNWLLADIGKTINKQPLQNTPYADFCRNTKKPSNFFECDDSYIDKVLAFKGETIYGTLCNPLSAIYSDDIVKAMSQTLNWGITILNLTGVALPGFGKRLYSEFLMNYVYSLVPDEKSYEAYYSEYLDFSDCWLGEVLFGTMARVFHGFTDKLESPDSVRGSLQACFLLFFLVYVLYRRNDELSRLLTRLAIFYSGTRYYKDGPITRAQTLATQGITSHKLLFDENNQPKKDAGLDKLRLLVSHTNGVIMHNKGTGFVEFFMLAPKLKTKFPCYKFKSLPDLKSKYLFYWQNINTDNTLATLRENYHNNEMPIDKEDYKTFRELIVAGYELFSDTRAGNLNTFIHNILRQGKIKVASEDTIAELTALRNDNNQLQSEHTTVKRSLDKLRNRYNTLEAENKRLKEQLADCKKTIASNQQQAGIIAEAGKAAAQMQALQTKYSKAQARIANLEKQTGNTTWLEMEIDHLKKSLDNANKLVKALEYELEKASDSSAQPAEKPEQFTQEEKDLLAKVKCHMVLPDLPSLKELKHIMPCATFNFIPNDRNVVLTPHSTSVDFCVICTKMMGHGYFYRLKQDYKHKPELLVMAHTVGNLAICRVVLAKAYELGIDKLDR